MIFVGPRQWFLFSRHFRFFELTERSQTNFDRRRVVGLRERSVAFVQIVDQVEEAREHVVDVLKFEIGLHGLAHQVQFDHAVIRETLLLKYLNLNKKIQMFDKKIRDKVGGVSRPLKCSKSNKKSHRWYSNVFLDQSKNQEMSGER